MMNRISIYGKPSYTYDVLKGRVLETINNANLGIPLGEYNSVKMFIDENIDSIPAVSIDDEIRTIGKSKLEEFIQEVQAWILSEHEADLTKRIVAGIDLASTGKDVFNYALNLSKNLGFDLELVHACHPTPNQLRNITWDGIIRQKEQKLNDLVFASRIEDNNKIKICNRVIQGLAGDVLATIGSEEENMIMVVGTKPSNKNLKNILGSVSLSTIQHSKIPVIVLPANTSTSKVEKVAFAILDFEKDKQSFLEFNKYMNEAYNELHCITFENPGYPQVEFENFVRTINPSIKLRFTHLSEGSLMDSINQYCLVNEIDLLVTTKLTKGFFKRIFETSLTKELSIEPTIPLLILH